MRPQVLGVSPVDIGGVLGSHARHQPLGKLAAGGEAIPLDRDVAFFLHVGIGDSLVGHVLGLPLGQLGVRIGRLGALCPMQDLVRL
ncbi:MAG: hypothetical protein M1546_15335, partial [Chloroflexi bacterium]|nr:hypothetical protein [Chloroflexota bacterium]